MNQANDWWIYRGTGKRHSRITTHLPPPPPWRTFDSQARNARGARYRPEPREIELVNAALVLRRPLLVTGKPGTGKSSLAYAVAHELGLEDVLVWPISSRSTLKDGLYSYDAVARIEEAAISRGERSNVEVTAETVSEIGNYIKLGPLGTSLLGTTHKPPRPRVLLIDEIDKSDIDLPNDLLNIFEEGEFEVPELARYPESQGGRPVSVRSYDRGQRVDVLDGIVRCKIFPFVVLTSNGEREFPPAFLRRCLRLTVPEPSKAKLEEIVRTRLGLPRDLPMQVQQLIDEFFNRRNSQAHDIATDQLLNAVHLLLQGIDPLARDAEALRKDIERVRRDAVPNDVILRDGTLFDDVAQSLTETGQQ